jgi:hypothetical protein
MISHLRVSRFRSLVFVDPDHPLGSKGPGRPARKWKGRALQSCCVGTETVSNASHEGNIASQGTCYAESRIVCSGEAAWSTSSYQVIHPPIGRNIQIPWIEVFQASAEATSAKPALKGVSS